MYPSLVQAYRFRLRREAFCAGRTGMAPNEWRLTGCEPRAFEAALVWMELKPGRMVNPSANRPTYGSTWCVGGIASIMIYKPNKRGSSICWNSFRQRSMPFNCIYHLLISAGSPVIHALVGANFVIGHVVHRDPTRSYRLQSNQFSTQLKALCRSAKARRNFQ